MPALEAAFPAFRTTFARSSRHAAQAWELLTELAAQDLAACGAPPRIADLRSLSVARQANVLRHWLATAHNQTPTGAQLDALLTQLAACATRGHRIRLKAGQGFVSRADDVLRWSVNG
jgi:tRNA(Ile)-lysidine synthase